MWIMKLVWPLTAHFWSLLWTAGYNVLGRASADGASDKQDDAKPPFRVMVAKGTTYCAAGRASGDIVVEWAAFAAPTIAVWWHTLFVEKTFAVWILDYIMAFGISIFLSILRSR
jgi:hypothetical protein